MSLLIITLRKSRISNLDSPYSVYEIDCDDRKSTYIGQSKRFLSKRKVELECCVKNYEAKSILASHALSASHKFKSNNINLTTEKNRTKREFLEMFNKEYQPNKIMQDIMFLKKFLKKLNK